jgi:hypothetical protein
MTFSHIINYSEKKLIIVTTKQYLKQKYLEHFWGTFRFVCSFDFLLNRARASTLENENKSPRKKQTKPKIFAQTVTNRPFWQKKFGTRSTLQIDLIRLLRRRNFLAKIVRTSGNKALKGKLKLKIYSTVEHLAHSRFEKPTKYVLEICEIVFFMLGKDQTMTFLRSELSYKKTYTKDVQTA